MDAQKEQPQADHADQADQVELNDFGKIAFHFLKFGQNATNNMSKAFGDMTLEQWIRVVIIVGAYLLLRPHLINFMGKREVAKKVKADNAAKAAISPNELRGGKSHPMFGDADDDEDEDQGQTSGADWGARARTRQRTMLKQLMEAEERRKAEEESDEEIADLLVD